MYLLLDWTVDCSRAFNVELFWEFREIPLDQCSAFAVMDRTLKQKGVERGMSLVHGACSESRVGHFTVGLLAMWDRCGLIANG